MKKITSLLFVSVFMHINIYSQANDDDNYSIEKFQLIVNNDTIYLNELRFNKNLIVNSYDTQQAMFNKYGKWDKVVLTKKIMNPF